jgi:NitT/TauT family transport system ATP-binding protein
MTELDSNNTAWANPEVVLSNVCFSYSSGWEALQGVSLVVPHGATMSIIGPSGCGKSTLLRLVAGLHEPSRGEVWCRPAPSGRLPVSMVFQEDVLLPWMTVGTNVNLCRRFQRTPLRSRLSKWLGKYGSPQPESTDDDHSARLLSLVGLSEAANLHPRELSGGMRRRVGVLQALAPSPALLLLDEPFSAVDEPTRIGIHGDVRELLRTLDVTSILVTHDVAEAIAMGDFVAILSTVPAHVVTIVAVPFTGSRDMQELRNTPEFLQLYGAIWEQLSKVMSGEL